MGNSPIVHTDPNGDALPAIAVAAIIGGIIGGAANTYNQYKQGNLKSTGDVLGAFGIGAVAGAVGAAVGTVAVMGSAAAFATGTAASAAAGGITIGGYSLGTTGVISGAVSGAIGETIGSPLRQLGNMVAGWQDDFSFQEYGASILGGAIFGGITGGAAAYLKGQNIFWGNSTPRTGIQVLDYDAVFPDGTSLKTGTPIANQYKGYTSMRAFRADYGSAGRGNNWHHIVEQGGGNTARFGPENIHNTRNVIRLQSGRGSIHSKVSGFYSSKQPFTNGLTVRQWLRPQSYQAQYKFGISILQRFGWTP